MQLLNTDLPAQFDRLPPNSIEAEMALLGSLMLETTGQAVRECRNVIPTDAFFLADHQFIFEALCKLAGSSRGIDAVNVRAVLEKSGRLDEIGGTAYLAKVLGCVPVWQHWRDYADIVLERYRQRQIILAATAAVQAVYSRDSTAHEIISATNAKLAAVGALGVTSQARHVSDLIREFGEHRKKGTSTAIPTGFADLDSDFLGLVSLGEMTLIAGRPGMGKSTFMRQLALNLAQVGVVVGFISLEEGEQKIAGNYVANVQGIENQHLANGSLSEQQHEAIANTATVLQDFPLYFARSHSALPKVLAVAETLITQRQAQVVMIDHLHEISLHGLEGEAKVREIAHAVCQLTKTRNVAGVYACQLNRGNESRDDKQPSLADLRQSGALEEKADNVILLYREDYYHRNDTTWTAKNEISVGIAKKRNGATGVATLSCHMPTQRIRNGARSHDYGFGG